VEHPKGSEGEAGEIKAIVEMREPANVKELRSASGVLGFCRGFVDGYAEMARPLTDLLSAATAFEWGKEQQTAFERLKRAVRDSPALALLTRR
jgi:hypothetical protein